VARVPPVYRPRDAEATVLDTVIREHRDDFLRAAADPEGGGLPPFVEREFREFLTCGVLAHGFARLRCEGCAFERLVPFSCCPDRDTMKSSPPPGRCSWVLAMDALRISSDQKARR